MIAVIKTGGKQYVVTPGQKLKVEKLGVSEGEPFVFKDVLLVADGDKVKVGRPTVSGAGVEAKVLKNSRRPKIIVFHYKAKKRYKKKKGHRQPFSEVEITRITFGS